MAIVKSIISLICLINFVYFIYHVSTRYFNYATYTELKLSNDIEHPALSICSFKSELTRLDVKNAKIVKFEIYDLKCYKIVNMADFSIGNSYEIKLEKGKIFVVYIHDMNMLPNDDSIPFQVESTEGK